MLSECQTVWSQISPVICWAWAGLILFAADKTSRQIIKIWMSKRVYLVFWYGLCLCRYQCLAAWHFLVCVRYLIKEWIDWKQIGIPEPFTPFVIFRSWHHFLFLDNIKKIQENSKLIFEYFKRANASFSINFQIHDILNASKALLWSHGWKFLDLSWIQDFEADFPKKVSLKMLN